VRPAASLCQGNSHALVDAATDSCLKKREPVRSADTDEFNIVCSMPTPRLKPGTRKPEHRASSPVSKLAVNGNAGVLDRRDTPETLGAVSAVGKHPPNPHIVDRKPAS
jgi:hypothetical protein